jgi:hypothetical protein
MRQAIIIFCHLGSLTVLAASTDLFEHFVMFVLFGFLPGREQPLSANQMLAIYGFATVAVFAFTTLTPALRLLRRVRLALTIRRSETA